MKNFVRFDFYQKFLHRISPFDVKNFFFDIKKFLLSIFFIPLITT